MDEKEALIRQIKLKDQLANLERKKYSYKAPNPNMIGYIGLTGIILVAIISVFGIFLNKSDKDKCRC